MGKDNLELTRFWNFLFYDQTLSWKTYSFPLELYEVLCYYYFSEPEFSDIQNFKLLNTKYRCAMNICESLGIIIVQSTITCEFDVQSSNSKVMQNTLILKQIY